MSQKVLSSHLLECEFLSSGSGQLCPAQLIRWKTLFSLNVPQVWKCDCFFLFLQTKSGYLNCVPTLKLHYTHVYIWYFAWPIKASHLSYSYDFICAQLIPTSKQILFSVILGSLYNQNTKKLHMIFYSTHLGFGLI